MEYITDDSLLDIIAHLRPQVHLDALVCVASWLKKRIDNARVTHSWKPGGQGRFAHAFQITPFQDVCLDELFSNHHTSVPDMDNAITVSRGFAFYFKTLPAKERPKGKIRILDSMDAVEIHEDDYTICISDYPLPVDEYTPLWKFSTPGMITITGDCIDFYNVFDRTELPMQGMVQFGGERLTTRLPYLICSKAISYRDLAPYETFLCLPGINTSRLASLLMQFSPTPKKLLIYNMNFLSLCGTTSVISAKKRFQYCTEIHTMEINLQQIIAIPGLKRGMNNAEYCISACGYNHARSKEYDAWLQNIRGEDTAPLLPQPFFMQTTNFWAFIDPGADWKDIVSMMSTKSLFYPEEVEKELAQHRELKRKIKVSLSTTRGKTGTDSLTLAEVKELCKKKDVRGTGSRKELLEALLVHVKSNIANI